MTPADREKNAAKQRRWRSANVERARELDSGPASRRRKMWQLYGLTLEQWDTMFEAQGRRCACCGATSPGSKLGWHVDHVHGTKEIRGIVCLKCNQILGSLGDDATSVVYSTQTLLAYLARSGDVYAFTG